MLLPVFVICTLQLLSHCSNKIHTIKTAQFLSFKTGCSYPRITVSSWCPDQDIRNYYPKILNYFGIIIINWTKEGVPPQLTRRRAPTRASPHNSHADEHRRGRPPTTHTQTSNNEGAPPRNSRADEGVPPPLTQRRECSPAIRTQTRASPPRDSREDEGVPLATHAQTRVFPPPFTYRRRVFPRPTHADDSAPISPHSPDRPEKRGYPNKRKLTFKLLDVLISSRLQVLDKTF